MTLERIKTGIPRLDDYLGGGVPRGKTLCYFVQPGVVGDVFGMQTMARAIKEGGRGLFVTFIMEPREVRERFKE